MLDKLIGLVKQYQAVDKACDDQEITFCGVSHDRVQVYDLATLMKVAPDGAEITEEPGYAKNTSEYYFLVDGIRVCAIDVPGLLNF